MSRKLDWSKHKITSKPALSVLDEKEFRGKDAAARWLEKNEKKGRRK